MASGRTDHQALAEALRRRVLEGPGLTDPELRRAAAERAAGAGPTGGPYDDLASQIGISARRVTDAQVAAVVAAARSEAAAFEVIMASALGAGLLRWRRGLEALDEAGDAPA